MTFTHAIANALAMGALAGTAFLATAGDAVAQVFECGFFQENAEDGKPNKASCAMYPEKVFESGDRTPDRRAHCIVEPVKGLEDLENVVVDLGNGSVSWTNVYHLSDHERNEMKAYFTGVKGYAEALAARRAAPEVRTHYEFKISVAHGTVKKIDYDREHDRPVKPPKRVTEHNIMFENEFWNYVLYIPEDSGESVLTEFGGTGEHSWVNIRFGTCRMKSR